MKTLSWLLVALLLALCLWGWMRPSVKETRTVRDTVVIRDTLRDTVPRPLLVRFDHWDTIHFPVPIYEGTDTVRDTLFIPVPIEQKEYRTEDYHAIISGYRPSLDLMEVFRKTQTVTVVQKPKRWGLGLQAGAGWPTGWYVGVGISYDIWQW